MFLLKHVVEASSKNLYVPIATFFEYIFSSLNIMSFD